MEQTKLNQEFNQAPRGHILMITNHGCHSPVISVTIDTAGQNFYVNDYAKALVNLGYKVTILNRGGFNHPVTGEAQKGIKYYKEAWGEEIGGYCRVIYLEDGIPEFIEKEKLEEENLVKEKEHLFQISEEINLDFSQIIYMNSHYWDAGILGIIINEELEKRELKKLPHVWTSHSLGILKRENYKDESKEVIEALNFSKRIALEERILSEVDGNVSNAQIISDTLPKYETKPKNDLWFPPGVDTTNYHPRQKADCTSAIKVLSEETDKSEEEILKMVTEKTVIFEISRTQESKRKDLILEAFSQIKNENKAMLIMAINKGNETYDQLMAIYEENKDKNIILLDRFIQRHEGAELYSLSDIFATSAQTESWGMTSHEAAASECAVISSKFVPSVTEVLKENAVIIEENDPILYAKAMDQLIENPDKREKLAKNSKELVFENYSWNALTKNFLQELKDKGIINK